MVRLYWPVALRPAFDALFAIDDALAEVVATSTQPALGAIRLAWWREALERLDTSPPPPEPRLKAAASELLTRGIGGAELAGIEVGWAALFDEPPDNHLIETRGALLFGLGGRLLGVADDALPDAGALYARIDVARRGMGDGSRLAKPVGRHHFSRRARPLTALAALASRDARRTGVGWEPEATPARAATLLWHRITGVIG